MKNEQALEILEHNWTKLVNPDCTDEELGHALELAIKAFEFIEENYPKTFDDYLKGEEI